MDWNLFIATLGLLVATLDYLGNVWKSMKHKEIEDVGINIVRLITIIDKIIETGDDLLNVLAKLPLTNKSKANVNGTTREIFQLIRVQNKQLDEFIDAMNSPINSIRSRVPVSLGTAIEILVSDKTALSEIYIDKNGAKRQYLRILTWKLLEEQGPFNQLGIAARLALDTLSRATKLNTRRNSRVSILRRPLPTLTFPTKIKIREDANKQLHIVESKKKDNWVSYDLNKPADLRRLLEKANQQLSEIKTLRDRLKDLTRDIFDLSIM